LPRFFGSSPQAIVAASFYPRPARSLCSLVAHSPHMFLLFKASHRIIRTSSDLFETEQTPCLLFS